MVLVFLFGSGFLFLFLKFFSKKLLVLLSLEGSMLILILFFVTVFGGGVSTLFSICLLLVIMMVLDSVMGLSLLVSSSRNSFHFNSFFNSF